MSAALLVLSACCCSSSVGAGAFFGGFIPGTPQFIAKKIEKAPEGEDVSGFCNEFREINNDNENRPCLSYYWDEFKKEFIKDDNYFLNTFGDISGTSGPVIAKCKAVGVDIS